MKKILILVGIIVIFFSINTIQGANGLAVLSDIEVDGMLVNIIIDKSVQYNVFTVSDPERLVIDLRNVQHNVPKKTMKPDSSLIKYIRSSQFKPNIARVVIDLTKKVQYTATAKDNGIQISLIVNGKEKPAEKKKSSKKDKVAEKEKQYGVVLPKTPVTLEYQDADIRDVLQVMSIRSGVNMIYGNDVNGTITISLKDVAFDQAFKTILSLKGLTFLPVGDNILRVITPDQLTSERSKAVTYTRIFPLNYATADDVKINLDAIRGVEGRKGITDVDLRTNSLIVTDTMEGLESVASLIKQIDVKPLQVMIEAKIVDVRLDSLTEIGVNWSSLSMSQNAGTGVDVADQTALTVGGDVSATITGNTVGGVSGSSIKTNLTAPGTGGIFNFGFVSGRDVFNMTMGALITDGKAKVLSAPKVTTINNKEARILAGEKLPYKTTVIAENGTTQESWEYIDLGVKLTVTPTISRSGSVTLHVKPEVSVPSASGGGGALPPVRTREAEVTVVVDNKDTLVIGGLIDENDITSMSKVPLLGDLPILGALFKYRMKSKARTELVIFLTPKIIED